MLLVMMMWVAVTALPSSSPFLPTSSSVSSSRQNGRENSDLRRILCQLNRGVCVSYSRPCSCVPAWQCKEEDAAAEAADILSIVLNSSRCVAPEEVCCVQVDENAPPPTPPPFTPSCGVRNVQGVGGTAEELKEQQSRYGEFPWTAVVFSEIVVDDVDLQIFTSGGSLVHRQLVLTVAHAVKDFSAGQLHVRLGEWNLDTETEAVPPQDLGVAEVLLHPDYSGPPYHHYDVALLVLERPAVLSSTVSTVCLPSAEEDYLQARCVVSGWGKKKFEDSSTFQAVMKAVDMPLVEHDTCQTALQGTRIGPGFVLHDSFLCAGGEKEGQDACTGDGGSPLVCPLRGDPSRYVQVGVVAMGVECGQMGVPGVYADVVTVQPWISQVIDTTVSGSEEHTQHQRTPRRKGTYLLLL